MQLFVPTALALMMVSGAWPALAAPPEAPRAWNISTYSWVRRSPAEKGAPANGQPLRVEAEVLVQALGTVRVLTGSVEEPLFTPSEAADLGKILAGALAVAKPDEDLELMSTAKRDPGMFGLALSVAARLFARDGKLNLIVRDGRMDWAYGYSLNLRMPPFDYGSRAAAGTAVLKAAGAEARRSDWLILPLPAKAPAAVSQPASPQATPRPPSLEDRLRSLRQLRDQNLISEEDYAKKKEELLKAL